MQLLNGVTMFKLNTIIAQFSNTNAHMVRLFSLSKAHQFRKITKSIPFNLLMEFRMHVIINSGQELILIISIFQLTIHHNNLITEASKTNSMFLFCKTNF